MFAPVVPLRELVPGTLLRYLRGDVQKLGIVVWHKHTALHGSRNKERRMIGVIWDPSAVEAYRVYDGDLNGYTIKVVQKP